MSKKRTQNNYSQNSQGGQGGVTEDGFLRISLVNQGVFIKKKKVCPLKDFSVAEVNYKNIKLLNKFLSERGKIIPRRVTNVSVEKQRALKDAIKMARHLALISPVAKETISN